MVRAGVCTVAAVVLFVPLAVWLYSFGSVTPAERQNIAQNFVTPEVCQPEPGERLAYLGGIVFIPIAVFALAFAHTRWGIRFQPSPAIVLAVECLLALALIGVAWLALRGDDYFHVRLNLFFQHPLLAIPLLSAAFVALRWDLGGKRFVRFALHLVALGLAAYVFLGSVFDAKGWYTGGLHFNAVFFPVVQVWEGKVLLVDCGSQYGLYPHLLQPLFAVTGLTVLSFTLVMGSMTAGSYAALWAFLARASKNRTAAFIGFAALLFNGWFSFIHRANLDLYFQYYPIRFLFPAVLVPLAWRQLQQPTRPLYWTIQVFLAVGVLWNLDSGLPTLLAWTATLCFAELYGRGWRLVARGIAGHLAAAGAVLAAVVILYSTTIRLRYGAFPDYGQFFYFQRLYYGVGYNKVPLILPAAWILVALVYILGLAHAAFSLASRCGTPRAKMVFLLSVLGIGLSSYYQGASNPVVLLLVWWPCQILLTLLLDDLLTRVQNGRVGPLPWAVAAVVGWFLVGAACSLAPELGFLGASIQSNFQTMRDRTAQPQRRQEAELVKQFVPPGREVFIAGPHSALIHLASQRSAFGATSVYQMVRTDEFNELRDSLAQNPSTMVLIEKYTFTLEGWQAKNSGLGTLVDLLQQKYEVAAATENSLLFVRRSTDDLLSPDRDSVLHVGVRDDMAGNALSFGSFAPTSSWSLEMVVRASGSQVPNATLVSTHPGAGLGGFVIHCNSADSYTFLVGDGQAFLPILQFPLRQGEWHYLAVVYTEETFAAYVDGRQVASKFVPGLKIEKSLLPLQFGNWVGDNRPFNGQIREIRVSDRALSSAEIANDAERVREKLP